MKNNKKVITTIEYDGVNSTHSSTVSEPIITKNTTVTSQTIKYNDNFGNNSLNIELDNNAQPGNCEIIFNNRVSGSKKPESIYTDSSIINSDNDLNNEEMIKKAKIEEELDSLLALSPYDEEQIKESANYKTEQTIKQYSNSGANIDGIDNLNQSFAQFIYDQNESVSLPIDKEKKHELNLGISVKKSDSGASLLISDLDVLNKYKDVKSVDFENNDDKKIYLPIIGRTVPSFFTNKTLFDEINILNEKNSYQIEKEIEQLTNVVSDIRQQLREYISKNNKDSSKKTIKAKSEAILSAVDNQVLLTNDIIFNIEYDWYVALFDNLKNYKLKTYYKNPSFVNPLIYNSISSKYDFNTQVNDLVKKLNLSTVNDESINQYYYAIKTLIENNLLELTDITTNQSYLNSFKTIIEYSCKKLLNLVQEFKVTYESQLKNKKHVYKKYLNNIKVAEKHINNISNKITKISNPKSIFQFNNLAAFAEQIKEFNNSLNDVAQLDLELNYSHSNLANEINSIIVMVLNSIEFIVDIQLANKTQTPNASFLEAERRRLYLFNLSNVDSKIKLTNSQINNIYNSYSNLDPSQLSNAVSKFGIFYLNKLINKIYIVLNASFDSYYNLIESINTQNYSNQNHKFISSITKFTNPLKDLNNILAKTSNYFDQSNIKLINKANNLIKDVLHDAKKISTRKLDDNLVDIKNQLVELLNIISVSIDKLGVLANASFNAWSNAYISKKINGNSINDIKNSWESLEIFDINEYLYSQNYIKKHDCKDCKTFHNSQYIETKILTSYAKSIDFNKEIIKQLSDLLNIDNFNKVDAILTQEYLAEELNNVLIVEKGIISSLGIILNQLDAQLVSGQLKFIFNDANNILNNAVNNDAYKTTSFVSLVNEVILSTIKLWILKKLLGHQSLLELTRNKITTLTPEFSSLLYTDDYLKNITQSVYERIKTYRFSPEFNDDQLISYYYCELTKILNINQQEQTLPIFEQETIITEKQEPIPETNVTIDFIHRKEIIEEQQPEPIVNPEPIVPIKKTVSIQYLENDLSFESVFPDTTYLYDEVEDEEPVEEFIEEPIEEVAEEPIEEVAEEPVEEQVILPPPEPIVIESEFLVTEYVSDLAPVEEINYNNIIKNIHVEYIPEVIKVNKKEFDLINEVKDNEVKFTFKDILHKDQIRSWYTLKLDYFDVKDVWTLNDFPIAPIKKPKLGFGKK